MDVERNDARTASTDRSDTIMDAERNQAAPDTSDRTDRAARQSAFETEFWNRDKRLIQAVAIIFLLHAIFFTVLIYVILPTIIGDWYVDVFLLGLLVPLSALILLLSFLQPLRHKVSRYLWYWALSINSVLLMVLIFSYRLFCFYGVVATFCMPSQGSSQQAFVNISFYAILGPLLTLVILRNEYKLQLFFVLFALVVYVWALIQSNPNATAWLSLALLIGAYVISFVSRYLQEKRDREEFELVRDLQEEIEAKVKAQNLQELAETQRDQFTSYIFHEIRVPMNAVVLGVNVLDGEQVYKNPEQAAQFEQLKSSLNDIENVINDTLDYRRTSREGVVKIDKQPIDLTRLIEHTVAETPRFYPDVEYRKHYGDSLANFRFKVLADPAKLKRVLSNYLSNAFKFTPSGHVDLYADLEPIDSDHATLKVTVQDTGIGIEKNEQAKLFQPYVNIESGVLVGKGTRLGLAISANLLRLMKGSYGAESEKGVGSTFRFAVPVETTDIPLSQETSEPVDQPLQNLQILFADDDLTTRLIMKRIFEQKMGHHVDVAVDGQEALEKILANPDRYDILFTDNQMPRMTGIELIENLRNRKFTLPIVSLTGSADLEEQSKLQQVGASHILIKPVTPPVLEKTLRMLVMQRNR